MYIFKEVIDIFFYKKKPAKMTALFHKTSLFDFIL